MEFPCGPLNKYPVRKTLRFFSGKFVWCWLMTLQFDNLVIFASHYFRTEFPLRHPVIDEISNNTKRITCSDSDHKFWFLSTSIVVRFTPYYPSTACRIKICNRLISKRCPAPTRNLPKKSKVRQKPQSLKAKNDTNHMDEDTNNWNNYFISSCFELFVEHQLR